MWQNSVLKFSLLLIVRCEFSTCSPLNYSEGIKLEISSAYHPLNVIIPVNRDEITDISELFSPDYWFPIEINVPDSLMTAWENLGEVWAYASDYFSMNNNEMSHYEINQNSLNV